jgi:hypothetical protein
VVAFDLRNLNTSFANVTQAGDCLQTLSLTLSPVGGTRLVCSTTLGCGVESGTKRAASEINGSSEAVELSFSAPVLLWAVEFGSWSPGLDSARIEMTPLFLNASAPSVNFTTTSARWSALASVLENGVEPPVVRRVVLRTSDSIASFSLLSIRAKPYVAPPVTFSQTLGSPASTKAPTEATTTDFAYQLKWWMENEAVYFWLVIAAIIVCLLICVCGIVIYCCCVKGDDDDEKYSMRDAPSSYDNDDWL